MRLVFKAIWLRFKQALSFGIYLGLTFLFIYILDWCIKSLAHNGAIGHLIVTIFAWVFCILMGGILPLTVLYFWIKEEYDELERQEWEERWKKKFR